MSTPTAPEQKAEREPVITQRSRGLFCSVLRDRFSIDGGDEVLLLCERGPFTVEDAERCKRPVVKLVRRNLFGKDYVHAEPTSEPPKGRVGYMAGGSFIYSCDSRFDDAVSNGGYPVSLHDHTEIPDTEFLDGEKAYIRANPQPTK